MENPQVMNTTKILCLLGIVLFALIQFGCTYTNKIPPVTTFENPSRSRTIGDYEVSGKVLAVQVCASCHGMNGYSNSPMFPHLGAQQKDYLVNQLKDYRDHTRSNEYGALYMWGIARNLTDNQIQELADYFSSKPVNQSSAEHVNESQLARGKAIFDKGIPEAGVMQCIACHGAEGKGAATFPRIAGQQPFYILQQLRVWRHPHEKKFMNAEGETWAPGTITFARPRGEPMMNHVKNLSDADAEAVALYLSKLK
jgi:cytochrome c553